ncbi:glycosyltransferase family 2 protein [Bacteroidota bacterium]
MKISVIIVTRNRKEDVRVSLKGYLSQTHPDTEIIVVDNESTDGTREMMAEDYPGIKYLWLPDNFDIRSINIGIEMSCGDIIWRTDSDSHPESEFAFEQVLEIFDKNPHIDIIATEDIEVRKGNQAWEWYPLPIDKSKIPEDGFKANFFPGTGAAIKREVYDKIGGFWEFGFEELDFCTRAIAAGFNVRYFPNIRTLHYASPQDRDNPNRWVKASKQYIRYNWRYFPFWRALGRSSQIFLFQIIFALMNRLPVSAIIEGMLGMLEIMFYTYRNERDIVPKEKLKDITLGVSVAHTQYRFFKQVFSNKLKKLWKS